tara:strand:- start:208 stop:1137 length:930 start_codon:yes stop_codon:yes gene_type:complete
MIIVTGGLGFIGKNLVKKINSSTKQEVIIVDKPEKKILKNNTYLNNLIFLKKLGNKNFAKKISIIFHQGANSNTAEKNFSSIMQDNFFYTKELISLCEKFDIPLIYASSASVYGRNPRGFSEREKLNPSNYYAISKSLIDLLVEKKIKKNKKIKIVGLRYFNVYGPGEEMKKRMASVFYHFNKQLKNQSFIKLFKGADSYKNGEQKRDFVHVNDCVNVNLFFYKKFKSGIYNVGSGMAATFNSVAKNICNANKKQASIKYIDMPNDILDGYQNYTKANIAKLRKAGYTATFTSLKIGSIKYLNRKNFIL